MKTLNLSKKKWPRRNSLIWFAVFVVLIVGVVVTIRRLDVRQSQKQALLSNALIPSVTLTSQEQESSHTDNKPMSKRTVSSEINLGVPFTSQAPSGNWDNQHEENCEEASLLMVSLFFDGRPIENPQDAEDGMAQIVNWENEHLGISDSIDAEQTAKIVKDFLNLKPEIIENPTIDQIKEAITNNKLVLVPASGRELKNPFFKQPGPVYHMLVIRGYKSDKFITNDPGTKHGENYIYDFKTILDANHEWNNGDVPNGRKMMVLVSK